MRLRIRLLVLGIGAALCSVAILAACSNPVVAPIRCKGSACKDAGESDDAPSITADSVCADLASAYCEQVERCTAFTFKLTYEDRDTCVGREKLKCVVGLTAPGTGATPTRLAECAAARRASSCEDTWARETPQACAVVGGAFDDGKPCVDSAQCKNRLCRLAADNTCGICTSVGVAGQACETGDQCEAPLDCIGKKCTALGKLGDSCSGNTCSTQLRCIGGKCNAPTPSGATCEWGDGVPDTCDRLNGFFCNTQNKTCVPIGTPSVNEACSFSETDIRYCVAGGWCNFTDGGAGTCQAPTADGLPCSAKTCVAPARCQSGLCTLPTPGACRQN